MNMIFIISYCQEDPAWLSIIRTIINIAVSNQGSKLDMLQVKNKNVNEFQVKTHMVIFHLMMKFYCSYLPYLSMARCYNLLGEN